MKPTRRISLVLILPAVLGSAWLVRARQAESGSEGPAVPPSVHSDTPEVLEGLRGVCVSVEGLSAEVEKAGLRRDDLRRGVEERLKAAGIRVFTEAQGAREPGRPCLCVNVSVTKPQGLPLYGWILKLQLREAVRLLRSPARIAADAVTWQRVGAGTVGLRGLQEMRSKVRYHLDAFISDYRKANRQDAAPTADR
ncbi:MAG: hypothetical protein ACUVTZ_12920 [Armatimonadota bacterium]